MSPDSSSSRTLLFVPMSQRDRQGARRRRRPAAGGRVCSGSMPADPRGPHQRGLQSQGHLRVCERPARRKLRVTPWTGRQRGRVFSGGNSRIIYKDA